MEYTLTFRCITWSSHAIGMKIIIDGEKTYRHYTSEVLKIRLSEGPHHLKIKNIIPFFYAQTDISVTEDTVITYRTRDDWVLLGMFLYVPLLISLEIFFNIRPLSAYLAYYIVWLVFEIAIRRRYFKIKAE